MINFWYLPIGQIEHKHKRLALLSDKSVVIHILVFIQFFWIAFSSIFKTLHRNRYSIHAMLQIQIAFCSIPMNYNYHLLFI